MTKTALATKIQKDRSAALAELTELCAMFDNGPAPSPEFITSVNLIVEALQRPAGDFAVGLSAVGNPDLGQYGGRGSMSPTCVVYAATLEDVIKLCSAYISVFDLGGGNCPDFPVISRDGRKLRVSYNGRVWKKGADGKDEEIPVGGRKTAAQHEAEGWKDYCVNPVPA